MGKYKPVDEWTLEEMQSLDIFWIGYRLGIENGVNMSIKEFKSLTEQWFEDLQEQGGSK